MHKSAEDVNTLSKEDIIHSRIVLGTGVLIVEDFGRQKIVVYRTSAELSQ